MVEVVIPEHLFIEYLHRLIRHDSSGKCFRVEKEQLRRFSFQSTSDIEWLNHQISQFKRQPYTIPRIPSCARLIHEAPKC